jgi:hypothetical protein
MKDGGLPFAFPPYELTLLRAQRSNPSFLGVSRWIAMPAVPARNDK